MPRLLHLSGEQDQRHKAKTSSRTRNMCSMDRAKQVATSLCVGCLFVFVFGLERSLSFGEFILACLGFDLTPENQRWIRDSVRLHPHFRGRREPDRGRGSAHLSSSKNVPVRSGAIAFGRRLSVSSRRSAGNGSPRTWSYMR